LTQSLPLSDWEAVIATNLTGAFLVSRAALKRMSRRRGGAIVNIGSVIGDFGGQGQASYASAKAGLVAFTKSIAKEGAARGVRANVVVPGAIATAMTEHLSVPTAAKGAPSFIPLGRLGQATEVADLVSFVASDLAAYMTGSVLVVDGGLSM
jgi:3-oxoacyl-[acyl-carrier protein] reductase